MKTTRTTPLQSLRIATATLLLASLSAFATAPAPAAPEAEEAEQAPAAPAAPAARVAVGAEIPYEGLVDYVGARIRVHTKGNTVREGVMTGYSSIAINLQVDGARGGFLLGMPRESVVKVELLADVAAKP